jgi:ribosomal protein L40E
MTITIKSINRELGISTHSATLSRLFCRLLDRDNDPCERGTLPPPSRAFPVSPSSSPPGPPCLNTPPRKAPPPMTSSLLSETASPLSCLARGPPNSDSCRSSPSSDLVGKRRLDRGGTGPELGPPGGMRSFGWLSCWRVRPWPTGGPDEGPGDGPTWASRAAAMIARACRDRCHLFELSLTFSESLTCILKCLRFERWRGWLGSAALGVRVWSSLGRLVLALHYSASSLCRVRL